MSRPTAYKWIERYHDGGVEAITDQSRARLTQHAKTSSEPERLLVKARRAHPTWDARKLLRYLGGRHDRVTWPAVSTAAAILVRHGLTKPRRKRHPPKHPGSTPLVTTAPNEVWTADYKGQFWMGDGELCSASSATRSRSATTTRATS